MSYDPLSIADVHTNINIRGAKEHQKVCLHQHIQVSWSASHLSRLGIGGYYEVGVFDTDVTCMTCAAQVSGGFSEAPLCQGCLMPMRIINSRNDQIEGATLRFKAKQKRDWQKYCGRMERIEKEQERRQPPRKPTTSFFEHLRHMQANTQDGMIRILQGSNRQQVWPYRCTNRDCVRYDRLKFLHTPGD